MTKTYILSSPKLAENFEVRYTDGICENIALPAKYPMSKKQFDAMICKIPHFETDLHLMIAETGLEISQVFGTNDKIAMFCTAFKDKYNRRYIVSPADTGRMKISDIKVTPDLLRFYMNSENWLFKGKHSIMNFTKYYNTVLIEFDGQHAPRYPDAYDEGFMRKLAPAEWAGYYRHLRSKGLVPKKDRLGNTLDWVKQL